MPPSRAEPVLYDHDAEEALLGALLIAPEYLKDIAWFQPGYFYSEHNALFLTLLRDHWKQQGGEADAITFNLSLLNSNKLDAVGGAACFCELVAGAGVPELVPHYAEGLRRLAEKRSGLKRAGEMARKAIEEPSEGPIKWGWNE